MMYWTGLGTGVPFNNPRYEWFYTGYPGENSKKKLLKKKKRRKLIDKRKK